ncbi:MAG: beta-propeller domain-containing protein [Thermoplasmata archaeon]|nr:beta-propeller domain-containing protein [Thermoplasmata archaeon]
MIKLKDSSLSVNGGNRTYHYLFRTVGEGNTYIEMDLMGISGGQIKKYGEFRLEISSYEPYWLYQNYRITRSLYIGDVLYTLSNMMVKSNGIEDMGEIDVLDFGTDQ